MLHGNIIWTHIVTAILFSGCST